MSFQFALALVAEAQHFSSRTCRAQARVRRGDAGVTGSEAYRRARVFAVHAVEGVRGICDVEDPRSGASSSTLDATYARPALCSCA